MKFFFISKVFAKKEINSFKKRFEKRLRKTKSIIIFTLSNFPEVDVCETDDDDVTKSVLNIKS